MRVTQGMLSNQVLFDIENNYQRLSEYQNEASTGKKINKPSDDPIGVQFVMQYDSENAYYQQYQQNAAQANATLNYTESAMNEAQTVMKRARDLAVEASTGTESATDMKALSSEVGQLYDQLVTVGNTQYNNQYVFNGQAIDTAPYSDADAASVTTQSGNVLYDLGNGVTLPVNTPGNTFFGNANVSDNAFQLLDQLKQALNNGDTQQAGKLLNGFDSRLNAMSDVQADVGARMNRAQMMQNRMSDLSQNVTKLLANTQGADMAKVLTKLSSAMAVQQASLKVGAQALVPTLVDFLK